MLFPLVGTWEMRQISFSHCAIGIPARHKSNSTYQYNIYDMKTIEVVAALIIKRGLFFAAQRGESMAHAMSWEFPGGKVEPGECHREALARELFEEFKIKAYATDFIATRETIEPERIIKVHLYKTIVESDTFTRTEHAQFQWISLAQAYDLTWTQADRAFLDLIGGVVESQKSLYEALPEDFDALPTRPRGAHIFRAVQKPWDAAQNPHHSIGHKTIQILETEFDASKLEIDDAIHAPDGTTRIIFKLHDGLKIETIHMPRDVKSPRVTLCISSQVGCAMNCAFCATATLGLRRNLTASEIVQQVICAVDAFGPSQSHAINIVFMGMGEALMNTDNVLRAIDILSHPNGLAIPPVRMTLSTSGILSELPKIQNAPNRPNIAISINATTDETRSKLMPINQKFPLASIRQTLADWPYRSHEKVLLEYVLLSGINDTDDDARRLAQFALRLPHNINIIPYNETPRDTFHAPTPDDVQRFIRILQDAGCLVTLRVARGVQVGGACGQLLAKRAKQND